MDASRFDQFARAAAIDSSRRTLLFGLGSGIATAIAGVPLRDTGAKNKRKKKKDDCKAPKCIEAPFTIEAVWGNASDDHDTTLYVPNLPGSTVPNPHLDIFCTPEDFSNGNIYPFAFLNKDATGPGNEIVTVKKLLNGRYEYWLQLDSGTRADTVLVRLVKKGQIQRVWSNPAGGAGEDNWRVFAITARKEKGTVVSLDEFPVEFPEVETSLCP